MTEIMASQPDELEGYTPDPELAEVVKRLAGYLQPVVTLMATMIPSTEKSKLREKRGREMLNQGTNMVLLVNVLFLLYFYQVKVDRYFDNILPLFFRALWLWLGRSKIVMDYEARGVVEGVWP